jgi:hypothetical protein
VKGDAKFTLTTGLDGHDEPLAGQRVIRILRELGRPFESLPAHLL